MVLKGKLRLPVFTPSSSSPLPSPILINTTSLSSMDHAMLFQSHWTTTPVSKPRQPDWSADQYSQAETWSNNSIWIYSSPTDVSTVEKCVDDNWGKLYQAILNFNEPPSIVCNALKFREDIPKLTGSSSGTLMPSLCYGFLYPYDMLSQLGTWACIWLLPHTVKGTSLSH